MHRTPSLALCITLLWTLSAAVPAQPQPVAPLGDLHGDGLGDAAAEARDDDDGGRNFGTPSQSAAPSGGGTATGTEYVSFWSGDLRIFAFADDTQIELTDVDTGLPLSMGDPRIGSTNFATNPFTLSSAGDSFEGVGGLGGINDEIRVRIVSSDATGGDEVKPIFVWTGSLDSLTRHPTNPPASGNPWMSYIPAFSESANSNGTEVGREFLGFTTRDMYIIALKGGDPTSITIEDLGTNTDPDTDDTQALGPADAVFSDAEIEAYFLNGFEDDTVRIASNVDLSVLVGYSSASADDWTATPPSYAAGDDGIELGTLFYTFVHQTLTIFPTMDDTTVTITDLSDGDDSKVVFLANGDTTGDYDLYTPSLASTSHGDIVPRPAAPAVNVLTNGGNTFDDDFVKVEANKPILVYVGPVASNTLEFADVAFSVPTGPDSRIIYAYAQNSGASNDLQIFGFDPDTVVTITSLTHTADFRDTGFHDFVVGPGIGGAGGWKEGTVGGDVWWGSDVWNGEMLRIESNKPITVISGDYDLPHFGAYIPFVLATPTLPPVANAGADQTVCAGAEVTFDGTGSFDQDTVDGGQPITYEWDFDITVDSDMDGDPANDVDATGPTPTHVYAAPGVFTTQLTFTDDDGESDTDFVTTTVEECEIIAGVDIKPGSCPNPLNRHSNGVLPVALVGTVEFDPAEVDLSTLQLSRGDGVGGSVPPIEGPPGPHSVLEDVATPFDGEGCECHDLGGDGIDDLSMKFRTRDLVDALELDDLPAGAVVELVLSGSLLDGTPFVAGDCIVIVPPGDHGPINATMGSNVGDTFIEVTPLDLNIDSDGFTSFDRAYYAGTLLTVTAPPTSEGRRFVRWMVDGVLQEIGVRTIEVAVAEDTTLRALYHLQRRLRPDRATESDEPLD